MVDMQKNNEFRYSAAVIAAGTLWGFMGLFRRFLGDAGVNSAGVILLRCGTAAILFFVYLIVFDRKSLKIRIRDSWCFFGTGICSMLFFTYCYFQAIELMTLSVAAIMLYTAPVFVVILSLFCFKESLGWKKVTALLIAFIGCCCVSGLGSDDQITVEGLLYGLGAGIGYALYSIFARFALQRGYNNFTINFYTHSLAALGAGVMWGVRDPILVAVSSPKFFLVTIILGLLTCFLPYLLYTYSLSGLETGKASIYATVEPVVASLVGVVVFSEALTIQTVSGIAFVLASVILLSIQKKEEAQC